jgi:hypothetical protein
MKKLNPMAANSGPRQRSSAIRNSDLAGFATLISVMNNRATQMKDIGPKTKGPPKAFRPWVDAPLRRSRHAQGPQHRHLLIEESLRLGGELGDILLWGFQRLAILHDPLTLGGEHTPAMIGPFRWRSHAKLRGF